MEPTRKYRKVINRNGWMAKLYEFSTGREPKFTGYCPFVWSTWFWVLMFPLTVAGKALEWFGSVFATLMKSDKVRLSDFEKYYVYIRLQDYNFVLEDYYNQSFDSAEFKKFVAQNKNWLEILKKGYEREKSKADSCFSNPEPIEEKKNEKLELLKEKAMKFAAWLVKPALVLSAIFAAWVIYTFLGYLYSIISLKDILGALLIVGVVVGALCLLFFIGRFVSSLWSVTREATIKEDKQPSVIASFAWSALKAIPNAIIFLFETGAMLYKKECPLIEWSDKTKPIEKNK